MMNPVRTPTLILAALVGALALVGGCATNESGSQADKYKMTTEMPPGIACPDKVHTRLGYSALLRRFP